MYHTLYLKFIHVYVLDQEVVLTKDVAEENQTPQTMQCQTLSNCQEPKQAPNDIQTLPYEEFLPPLQSSAPNSNSHLLVQYISDDQPDQESSFEQLLHAEEQIASQRFLGNMAILRRATRHQEYRGIMCNRDLERGKSSQKINFFGTAFPAFIIQKTNK